MLSKENVTLRDNSPYSAVLTREQFLFYETRTVARLLTEGVEPAEVVGRVVRENLFQYPTEKSIRGMAGVCVKRLQAMEEADLIRAIANSPSETAKQICLYAMMRQYRLVWDFMITVIGSKYRLLDNSFGKIDLNSFFMHLQEQDDWVATWSEATIARIKQVLTRILVETEYLDDLKADHLNPVLIEPILENAIRAAGLEIALPAFNCLS